MNIIQQVLNKVGRLYQNHERFLGPFLFIGGFTYDTLTITRIDRFLENGFILTYLVLLGVSIVVVGRERSGNRSIQFLKAYRDYFPYVIQFLLGGLFSVYTVFYFRSTSLNVSWVYLVLLMVLLVLNELLINRLTNLNLLLSMYFFTWFSFSVFFLPILLGRMGTDIFILGSLVSFIPVLLVIYSIYVPLSGNRMSNILRHCSWVAVVFIVIQGLYGLNYIPPIPLAMQDSGIYRSVEKINDRYRVVKTGDKWYDDYYPFGQVIYYDGSEPVYCFVSVFAPVDLQTTIRHQWQRYQEEKNSWVTSDNLDYTIQGGRRGGYRGYTYKENLRTGHWRVNVLTPNGRIVGRIPFEIKPLTEEQNRTYHTIMK